MALETDLVLILGKRYALKFDAVIFGEQVTVEKR